MTVARPAPPDALLKPMDYSGRSFKVLSHDISHDTSHDTPLDYFSYLWSHYSLFLKPSNLWTLLVYKNQIISNCNVYILYFLHDTNGVLIWAN